MSRYAQSEITTFKKIYYVNFQSDNLEDFILCVQNIFRTNNFLMNILFCINFQNKVLLGTFE